MTPLRERMTNDLRLRNRSVGTIKSYVGHIAAFARYFGHSPADLGPEEIRQYQLHLLNEKHVSWSTFNQCTCALRFLYSTTLDRSWPVERLPYGRRPKRLPIVLSSDEVQQLLQWTKSLKHRTVLTTMYATGMRVGEVVQLAVPDIDSRSMTILVQRGKGNKQRLIPLSHGLLRELRNWWCQHHDPIWLFPGAIPDRPLTISAVQRALKIAVKSAGLTRSINTHALRHTFATELLEAGVDILTIQKILGHTSLSTTAIYTHVRRDHLQVARAVLDLLPFDQLVRRQPAPRQPRRLAISSANTEHPSSLATATG